LSLAGGDGMAALPLSPLRRGGVVWPILEPEAPPEALVRAKRQLGSGS
jgi:hypothetical protein